LVLNHKNASYKEEWNKEEWEKFKERRIKIEGEKWENIR